MRLEEWLWTKVVFEINVVNLNIKETFQLKTNFQTPANMCNNVCDEPMGILITVWGRNMFIFYIIVATGEPEIGDAFQSQQSIPDQASVLNSAI